MFSRFFPPKKPANCAKNPTNSTIIGPDPFPITWITQNLQGNFALSQAPGKKIAKGRNGKKFDRDLGNDVKYIKETHNISVIVCLLNKYELRTIGINVDEYKKLCEKKNQIELFIYPILEMGAPQDEMKTFHFEVIEKIAKEIMAGRNVLIHCRGGIGRAGTIASCLLLFLKIFDSAMDAVKFLRSIRDKRCVESRKQYDFIEEYRTYLLNCALSKK